MRADAQANRDQIVRTAWTLFAEQGPDFSLRQVAHDAGVGIGTLYRHFPTRVDLFLGVASEIRDRLSAIGERHAGEWDTDPEAAWRGFVGDVAALRLGVLASLASSAELDIEDLAERTASVRVEVLDVVDKVLDRAKNAGLVRADLQPARFQFGLAAITRPLPNPVIQAEAPALIDWLVEVYLAGLRP